jgi:hypothetical protein
MSTATSPVVKKDENESSLVVNRSWLSTEDEGGDFDGLFAGKNFKQGEIVTTYTGEIYRTGKYNFSSLLNPLMAFRIQFFPSAFFFPFILTYLLYPDDSLNFKP